MFQLSQKYLDTEQFVTLCAALFYEFIGVNL